MIVKCCYPDEVQDELLKGQYIFGLGVKEIQDHLLGEIVTEDTAEKCLLESHKIESKIEQRKLLGIKTFMTYDEIYRGRNKSRNKSIHGKNRSSSNNKSCSIVEKCIAKVIVPPMGKSVKNVEEKNTLNLSVEVVVTVMRNETIVIQGQGKVKRAKDSMR